MACPGAYPRLPYSVIASPLSQETPKESAPPAARTALIAIGAGAVVLIIVLLLALRGEGAGGFTGSDTVEKIARASWRVTQFEPVSAPAGKVGDWLLTKGFERYRVPTGLENLPVQGCALTEYEDKTVVVLQLEGETRRACIFLATPAGIELEPGVWEIFAADSKPVSLAMAAESAQGVCFVISSPQDESSLRSWLEAQGVRLR